MPRISALATTTNVGYVSVIDGGSTRRVLLGTMALQNAGAVAVTGGTVSGLSTLTVTGASTIGTGGDSNITTAGRIIGGFGSRATTGTLDWNDSSNATSGSGYSVMRATTGGANAPPSDTNQFFMPFCFEYGAMNGTGQITQFAIPYASGIDTAACSGLWVRGRFSGVWSSWRRIPMLDATTNALDCGGYKVSGTQVLGTRKTGWSASTGTAARGAFDTETATATVVARQLKALKDDLLSHGIIGA